MMAELHNRITTFLSNLKSKDAAERRDAFMNEVMETGGNYIAPQPDQTNCTHLYEIQLHGVSAWGFGEDEAIHNWQVAAARCVSDLVEDDGFVTVHPPFPTPRNHAEEIANARAAFESNRA